MTSNLRAVGAILVVAGGLFLSTVHAKDTVSAARYLNAGRTAGVELISQVDGTVKGHVFVGNGACTGEFFGEGYPSEGLVVLRTHEETDSCVVAMAFDGGQARVVEDRCLAWHGAGCSFSGTFRSTHTP